jgi:hypothetical protein
MIGGEPWRPLCPHPQPGAQRAYMAHLALQALSWGYRVRVHVEGEQQPVQGVLRAVSNGYPSQRAESDGGSTLLLQFQHGRSIPLERVARLERAAD